MEIMVSKTLYWMNDGGYIASIDISKPALIALFLAHQIEKSDVLPCVRNSYVTHVKSPKAHVILLNSVHVRVYRTSCNFIV